MTDRPSMPEPAYWFGQLLYLKVDAEGPAGMVTKICLCAGMVYAYEVQFPEDSGCYYEFELTDEKGYGAE